MASAGIKIRVNAGIKLVGNVGIVGTSVGAGGMVSRSKANTARDSPMACTVIKARFHAGISLVGNVGRVGSVVGGLSRLVRLVFFLS